MKVLIHVDAKQVQFNARTRSDNNAFIIRFKTRGIKHKDKQYFVSEVLFTGKSKLVNRPHTPLLGGTTAWIEASEDDVMVSLKPKGKMISLRSLRKEIEANRLPSAENYFRVENASNPYVGC